MCDPKENGVYQKIKNNITSNAAEMWCGRIMKENETAGQ